MSKWPVELGQFDINFFPRVAIKGQVLVDFVTEFSPRIVSLELGYPAASDHNKEGSSTRTSTSTEPTPEGLEVHKEPP